MIWSITEFLLRLKDDGSTFNEVQKVSGVPKQCLKTIQNVSFYKINQINKKQERIHFFGAKIQMRHFW